MVEMALTPEQQTVGLMFRPSVPADGGMLFDWGAPRDSAMWMRNTVSSLDMLFINADGTIRRVVENTVPQSLATIESRGPGGARRWSWRPGRRGGWTSAPGTGWSSGCFPRSAAAAAALDGARGSGRGAAW